MNNRGKIKKRMERKKASKSNTGSKNSNETNILINNEIKEKIKEILGIDKNEDSTYNLKETIYSNN